MAVQYVKKGATKADRFTLQTKTETGKNGQILLWGDPVRILEDRGDQVLIQARGRLDFHKGLVPKARLSADPLLEFYFIDVGQGDGVLIVTPARKHILIDGGFTRRHQPHGKSAADFVDWKFYKDYGLEHIHLDAMICSHCDADHFGGLWDIVRTDETKELDCKSITVDRFFHAGLNRFKTSGKAHNFGNLDQTKKFYTDLLGDKSTLSPQHQFQSGPLHGTWADFAAAVHKVTAEAARLGTDSTDLLGLEEPGITYQVLGPATHKINNTAGLKKYSTPSVTANGHSVTLRMQYGDASFLLTGDLNRESQLELMGLYPESDRDPLRVHVAKACHHGSDDVAYKFLERMNPEVTIIPSGDAEGHDHPRPRIVALSGLSGKKRTDSKGEPITPLVYSTEMARSTRLAQIKEAKVSKILTPLDQIDVTAKETKSGDIAPKTIKKSLDGSYIVAGIVYGLVNVRTDGKTIMIATKEETAEGWSVKSFDI